jgi:hypothetical protein
VFEFLFHDGIRAPSRMRELNSLAVDEESGLDMNMQFAGSAIDRRKPLVGASLVSVVPPIPAQRAFAAS